MKNEKSHILTPNYKQMNKVYSTYMYTLNSFKKSQIYTPYFSVEKHLNNCWSSDKQKSNNFMYSYTLMNATLTKTSILNTFIKSVFFNPAFLTSPKDT